MPEYPDIKVKLTGLDSNPGTIMGVVTEALRKANVPREVINQWRLDAMSGTYNDLLNRAMELVDVT